MYVVLVRIRTENNTKLAMPLYLNKHKNVQQRNTYVTKNDPGSKKTAIMTIHDMPQR